MDVTRYSHLACRALESARLAAIGELDARQCTERQGASTVGRSTATDVTSCSLACVFVCSVNDLSIAPGRNGPWAETHSWVLFGTKIFNVSLVDVLVVQRVSLLESKTCQYVGSMGHVERAAPGYSELLPARKRFHLLGRAVVPSNTVSVAVRGA